MFDLPYASEHFIYWSRANAKILNDSLDVVISIPRKNNAWTVGYRLIIDGDVYTSVTECPNADYAILARAVDGFVLFVVNNTSYIKGKSFNEASKAISDLTRETKSFIVKNMLPFGEVDTGLLIAKEVVLVDELKFKAYQKKASYKPVDIKYFIDNGFKHIEVCVQNNSLEKLDIFLDSVKGLDSLYGPVPNDPPLSVISADVVNGKFEAYIKTVE